MWFVIWIGAWSAPPPEEAPALVRRGLTDPKYGAEHVAELLRLMSTDNPIGRQATAAMDCADPAAVAPLIEAVQHSPDRRLAALRALAARGPQAAEAAPAVEPFANDPDLTTRRSALVALIEMRRARVETLIAATGHADLSLRLLAIRGLGRLGPDAAEAAPALAQIVAQDPEPSTRSAAADALAQLGPDALPAASALVGGLTAPDPRLRAASARALRAIGPACLPLLLEAIDAEQDAGRLVTLLQRLGQFGRAARPASDDLHQSLDHPDPAIRRAFAAALERIEVP